MNRIRVRLPAGEGNGREHGRRPGFASAYKIGVRVTAERTSCHDRTPTIAVVRSGSVSGQRGEALAQVGVEREILRVDVVLDRDFSGQGGLDGATRWILDRSVSRAAISPGPASRLIGMEAERVTASMTIEAAPEAVFAVLADPSGHADIDGTGWVGRSLDGDRITAVGQVFRMAMYHENHPDKDYKIANLVDVFDEPRAIAWKPGTESPETGELSFGGWIWRYDLEATGPSRTRVTLTYDWSAVPPQVREYLQFPPFGRDHLDNSLQRLSDLVASG